MRLYADVNFSGPIIRALRRKGVDIMVAKEDGQGETLDPELLDHATALGRILLTHDSDFLLEAARRQEQGVFFVGVIYARQAKIPVGQLTEDLILIVEATDEAYWNSRVEFLPLQRYRTGTVPDTLDRDGRATGYRLRPAIASL